MRAVVAMSCDKLIREPKFTQLAMIPVPQGLAQAEERFAE